jgi:hypothetical protein
MTVSFRTCRNLLLLGGLVLVFPGMNKASAADVPPSSQPVQLHIPPAHIEGILQPVDPTRTCVVVSGGSSEVRLPIVADTSLWKESRQANGSVRGMILRDGRFSQGLVKVDTQGLGSSSTLHAALHFKVGGVEKKGKSATFSLHRMMTDWSEDATWFKAFPDRDAAWNGLKAGTDYEAKPFANWTTEALNDGQIVDIIGMDEAVAAWRDGKWPNFGFLLLMNGKALQCGVPTREQSLAARSYTLGGEGAGGLIIQPNLAEIRHVVVQPDDLLEASLQLTAVKRPGAAKPGKLDVEVFIALRPLSDRALQPGVDYDPRPIASCSVSQPIAAGTPIAIPGLAEMLRHAMSGEQKEPQLLVRATGAGTSLLVAGAAAKEAPMFQVALRPYPHATLFDQEVKPQPGVYTKLQDGHLYYGDRRLRLWGVVGYPTADRLIKMGFNAQRVWNPDPKFSKTASGFYSAESIKRGEPVTYKKGDGSKLDVWDQHFADLKSHGLFVMFAALQDGMPVEPLATDDSFIAPANDASFPAADWAEWKAAILAPKPNFAKMVFVDERLIAIRKRAARNLLTHVNQYTGKQYGQEENIAVYEIFNENGFTKFALEGGCDAWPAYFQAKFKLRWNEWLKSHYANDAALASAWGKLDSGESLEHATVKPGPTLATRATYSAARAADFVHFTVDLVDKFHQDFRSYCRTLAPDGVGVNVAPFSFDTQYRPCLPWNYTNSRADVNSFGMYFWDLKSSLGKPPSAYVIDSNTTEGAATILYETNNSRPDPFRAEYPLKLAALAGWQDWDGVFWHYWGAGESDESYLTTLLQYPAVTHYWTAVYQENDPVMCAAMALGGRMFLHQDIHPAPKPVIAQVGGGSIYGYNNYNGIDVAGQTFARGAKTRFEPQSPTGVLLDGSPPPVDAPKRLEGAVAAGDEIIWDWPNGRLIIDSPNAKAYAGKFTGPFKFKDGIVLGGVNTPSVNFAMVSTDGRPIVGADASRRIVMAAVADARNTDFQFNWDVHGGPVEMAKAVISKGRLPVLVDPVNYNIWFPTSLDGKFSRYDFALRPLDERPISGTNIVAQQGPTPFMSVLTIDHRGGAAAVPDIAVASIATARGATTPTTHPSGGVEISTDPWNPIAGVIWETDYESAYKSLKNSSLTFSSINPLDTAEKSEKTIVLSDARLSGFWDSAADVEIAFSSGKVQSVTMTFKQPPPFGSALVDLEKRLGPPAEKHTGAQFEQSIARWENPGKGLTAVMSESQGTMKIVFNRK